MSTAQSILMANGAKPKIISQVVPVGTLKNVYNSNLDRLYSRPSNLSRYIKNHFFADECETDTCSIVPSAESFYGDRACETCKFPFIYKGIKYETCTNVDQGPHSGGYWCSTQTFANGNHVTGSWGYCQDYCRQGLQGSLTK